LEIKECLSNSLHHLFLCMGNCEFLEMIDLSTNASFCADYLILFMAPFTSFFLFPVKLMLLMSANLVLDTSVLRVLASRL
jgi:hypothetical protein